MRRQPRGSVLALSLLILSMLLAIAVSGAMVVVVTKKSARATEKSMLAFQIADGAAENILKRVYKNTDATLSILATNLYTGAGTPSCNAGVISGTLPSGSGIYTATLYQNDGSKLSCSGSGYSTYAEWRSKLVHMVVSGSFAGTMRAIDVGVRP